MPSCRCRSVGAVESRGGRGGLGVHVEVEIEELKEKRVASVAEPDDVI